MSLKPSEEIIFSAEKENKQKSDSLISVPESPKTDFTKDPVVAEAWQAIGRTIINILIIITDFNPLTEGISLLADIAKIIRNTPGLYRHLKYNLDPTPDVKGIRGIGIAVGSELIEPFTGDFFPSHAIESSIQFFGYDLPRIRKGLKKIINQKTM
jgi:hypothetical protein